MKFLIDSFFSILAFFNYTKPVPFLYSEIENKKITVTKEKQYAGFTEFYIKNGKLLIKQKITDQKSFEKWIKEDIALFSVQFQPYVSPYFGAISNQVGCEKNFKPKPIDKANLSSNFKEVLLYKSNERFVAISCQNTSKPVYNSVYIALYCKSSGYKIALHQKIAHNTILELIEGFHCLKN